MAIKVENVERFQSTRVFVAVCDNCGKEAETQDRLYIGEPTLVYPPEGWIIASRIALDGMPANRLTICSTECLEDAIPSLRRLDVPLVSEPA